MPRPQTIQIESGGVIHLPPHLRRKYPDGLRLKVTSDNGTIVMTPVPAPDPMGRDPEVMRHFSEAVSELREWAERENVTVADMKRTLRKVRRERRAAAKSSS